MFQGITTMATFDNAKTLFATHGADTPLFSLENQQAWARVVDIHDGDTMKIVTDVIGGRPWKFILRLDGIDTPEIRTHDLEEKRAATVARDHIITRCAGTKTLKDSVAIVWVKFGAFDKYGRCLAQVFPVTSEGVPATESLSAELVRLGMAKAYDGGHKTEWTPAQLESIK